MGDNLTLDDIPYQEAISNQFNRDWAEGRPDLPIVDLPDNFVLTPVEPTSSLKTYEVFIDTRYDNRHDSIDANSDIAAIVNNGGNVAATVTLRYAEVSETYVGSDGNYYVATFTRIYVPAGDQYADAYQDNNGLYSENLGTLSAPGVRSYQIGTDPAIIGDSYAVEAGDFARIRLATPEEVATAQDRRQDAIDNGFVLKPDGTFGSPQNCFGPEVPIDMWPLDPEFALDPNNPYKQYDQNAVREKIWTKPIELIRPGDLVVAFDESDNLVPGPVTRTMTNDVKILLDFFGTRVTPGHVYYRADSRKSYKFETLIDILRDDGVIKHQDGTLIRAAINVPVGDPRDGFVAAITGTRKADGTVDIKDRGRIRLGTRFLVSKGGIWQSCTVYDLIEAGGGVVGDDELIRVGEREPMPFHWEFGDTLPKPEDYALKRSGTSLEDIYKAAEWEDQHPHMPPPMVMDGGPVQPLSHTELSIMPRNTPLAMGNETYAKSPRPMLNRK